MLSVETNYRASFGNSIVLQFPLYAVRYHKPFSSDHGGIRSVGTVTIKRDHVLAESVEGLLFASNVLLAWRVPATAL